MRQFYITLFVAFSSLFFSFTSLAQVTVAATAGTTCGSYTTLKSAFDAINAGTHQGAITIMISGNTTETASAKLNASSSPASYTSVLIRPTGTATVNGSLAAPLIDLNGATNVTIDGRIGGTGSIRNLTLSNTSITNNGSTSTIRFINSTQNNVLTWLNIEGSANGTIQIDSSLVGGGNDNIVISHNDIRPAGNNLPSYGIYSIGESATLANSRIQIIGNLIHDYFSPAGNSIGITADLFSTNWTISENHLYQTASRTSTANILHVPIYINYGNGHVVRNNYIGGAGPFATGAATTISGSFSNRYVGIVLSVGAGSAPKVDGNTITNINLSAIPNANEIQFAGIWIASGPALVGHNEGNTIGSMTGTGAITLNMSGANTNYNYGIVSLSSNAISIKNNNIGSITAGGTNTGFVVLRGIEGGNYSSLSAENNTIGGTTPNSLQTTSVNNSMAGFGLFPTVSGSTTTVNANTVRNVTNNGSGTNAASTWGVLINLQQPVNVFLNVTNNQISNLSAPSNGATAGSVMGIYAIPATTGHTADANYNGNTISNLSSESTGSSFLVHGIYNTIIYNNYLNINANTIHGLSSAAPNTISNSSTAVQGIVSYASAPGAVNINDNTIYNLESTAAAATHVNGIGSYYGHPSSTTMSGNRIYDLRNSNATAAGMVSGLFLVGGSPGGTGIFHVNNNMISLSPANVQVYGLLNTATATKINAYFNSIYIGGTATGANNSAAFSRNGASVNTAIDSRNNIYYNVRTGGTGGHYSIINNSTTPATGWTTADYNNLYTSNPATTVLWGSTSMNLASYKTASGRETNSKAVVVNFQNAATADLHLAGSSATDANLNGTPITGITKDFDKETRNATTPKIGADEPLTCVSPAISAQPVTQTVCAGSPVTLNVTATGTSLYYQWRKSGSNIPGATGATFTITSTTTTDAASYDVVISNSCGTVTSGAATLSVNTAAFISSEPVAQVVCEGSPASFTVVASGAGLTYQWRKGGVNIAGANGATYSLATAAASNAGSYDVIVTGICSADTSVIAVLTVYTPPVITTQPSSQTVCSGSAASFTVSATGGCLNYQWRKDGVDISGATSATYTITSATAAHAGNYDVVISNFCSTTSVAAALIVNTPTAITTQPSAQTVCAGTPASITVTATGSNLSYQWRKAGTNIAGATNSTFTIANTTAADAANYDVIVTGSCGTVTSNAVALTVNSATTITTQPTAQTACEGTSATFSVSAAGTNLTYQWRKAGTNIPGATAATYTISSPTAADATNYDVVVSGSCGVVISSTVALTVYFTTTITSQPVSQTTCAGTAVTFSVTATGSFRSYQWRKGGTNIAGATATTYTITNPTAADAASYDVVVSGSCGVVTSNTVTLTVNPITTITSQPTAQTACAGAAATFSVSATGTNLSYQWRKGGTNITGATASAYTISSTVASDAASYDVLVSGTCGSVTSNSVTLTVNPVTTITTQPVAQTVCSGSAATFTVVAAGSGTLAYQWRLAGVNITGATSATYNIPSTTSASAGSYDVVVTGSCGTATSNSAMLTVNTCTSIPNIDPSVTSVQLMPNVVRSHTQLRVQVSRATTINWTVTDATGRIVMQFRRAFSAGQSDLPLDFSALSSGNYFITGMTSQGRTTVLKFIRL